YAPDWNGIVPYYVAYITGGTQYSGVPVENYNCDDPTTRILNFTPENGTTTGNNVDFSLYACVNEADIGLVSGIDIRLHNIDQN
ncbi:hypothetical protein ACQKG8_25485, partial [Escherichia coli]|uniref:hypothetical protein n=1 Tax=Escherichia coli TaxID=562 RepID=UPI003D032226